MASPGQPRLFGNWKGRCGVGAGHYGRGLRLGPYTGRNAGAYGHAFTRAYRDLYARTDGYAFRRAYDDVYARTDRHFCPSGYIHAYAPSCGDIDA